MFAIFRWRSWVEQGCWSRCDVFLFLHCFSVVESWPMNFDPWDFTSDVFGIHLNKLSLRAFSACPGIRSAHCCPFSAVTVGGPRSQKKTKTRKRKHWLQSCKVRLLCQQQLSRNWMAYAHINWTAKNEQWSWECKVNPTSLGKVRASESPSLLWSDETSSRLRGKLMYHNCSVVWWIRLNIRTDSYQAPNNVRSPREARLITQSLIACNAAPVKNPLRLTRYSPQCARRRLDSSAARRVWQGVVGRDSSCNQLGQCRLADWWNINGKWRRLRLRASLMHCYRSLFPFPSAALATPARCK